MAFIASFEFSAPGIVEPVAKPVETPVEKSVPFVKVELVFSVEFIAVKSVRDQPTLQPHS